MKRYSKYIIIILSYVIFLVLSYFLKGVGYTNWISLATTFVVFIFAIFLAFSISNRRVRIVSIRESLRESDGIIISLCNYSNVFGKSYSDDLLELIDNYIILQADYNLTDFKRTQGSFMVIYNHVSSTESKNGKEEDAKMAMMGDLESLAKLREKIEFNLSDKMQPYEWITIVSLALLTIFSMIYINDGSAVSLLILPILETVIVVIFITIFDLDSLKWQARNWIWEPLSTLFESLGLLPYFPEDLVKIGQITTSFLESFDSYRVGKYKYPYPNFKDKTVLVVNKSHKK